MTHELKKIIAAGITAQQNNQSSVLVTVVALIGASYRRPGVRMLITENSAMIGAVSGGCVEKEILRQSGSVFKTQTPKVMTYDGRYRLGCEGMLYILIEPFTITSELIQAFNTTIKERCDFKISSHFLKKDSSDDLYGSVFQFKNSTISLQQKEPDTTHEVFTQTLKPCNKLLIIGAEHDAVQLSNYTSLSGWEVTIIAPPTEEKDISYFTGAQELIAQAPELFDASIVDEHTAVVLMTHSYVKDLQYLLALKDSNPTYIGILGPAKRREKLLNEFLEHCPDVDYTFFDQIHGPAGLDIGAETPQEIAVSILSEMLSVFRDKNPIMLKNKQGGIHN